MTARTLMIQGASSSVGKSFLTAGLCRVFSRHGLRVAPFKSQNMALNAAITITGAEIGRAQAVQADAAGVVAEAAMNPILIKAEADGLCQVVVMGRSIGTMPAGSYRAMRSQLWPQVMEALDDLRSRFDLVLIEGAGSPAEVNLSQGEIVNMKVAEAADAPVLLVGDIDRGGIFAALLGTLDLLSPSHRARVHGLIVNRFRGDRELFAGGVEFLERQGSLPVVGVVPYVPIRLPVEDSLEIAVLRAPRPGSALDVAIIHLEHLSNFDEFDGLVGEPGVSVRLVDRAHELGQPDLIVLPGSKTTVVDLLALRSAGLDAAILAARQAGSAVLGICAGYQMLGHRIDDSLGVESVHESVPGLGLLPAWTTFGASKVTAQREATVVAGCGLLAQAKSQVLRGYEMRMGAVLSTATVPLILDGRSDGSMSDDGWVVGTSLHGLLSDRLTRRLVLEALAERKGVSLPPPAAPPSDPFDQLADVLEGSLDLAQIERMAGLVRV